ACSRAGVVRTLGMAPQQNRLLGIGLRVGAATSFGFMAAAIKLGDARGVSLPELAFYRFAFGLPPLLAWIALTRNAGAWRTQRPLAHLARAMLGLTTMVCAFAALTYLPLAEAATIGFAAPLFSVMLSALVLNEPVGRHRWSAVALGLIGVVIVIWFTLFSMAATGLFLPWFGRAHDATTWSILIGLGLAGGCGQLFLTSA